MNKIEPNKNLTTEFKEKRSKQLLAKAKKLIKEHGMDILMLSDVYSYLGISETTFYDYFPSTSAASAELKALLEGNRVKMKVNLRKKMYNSKNALGHIALYKLIGTDEERAILNQQEVRLSGSVNTSVTSKQTVVFKTREKKDE